MTQLAGFKMPKTYKNIYYKIYTWENLILAFKKARKGKTKKPYVKEFESNLIENLRQLQLELMTETYKPQPLKTFILRDPKTRKINKSEFRDRIAHHAIINIIQSLFEITFIYDSCSNQKGKGTLFAIKRLDKFMRQCSKNHTKNIFCLKADIKHYFQEVDHKVLLNILKRKIKDERTIWLIKQILNNNVVRERDGQRITRRGMPLGNLTSQFFANIYLNELDYFVKHKLKAKYYIRYVDDFIILHKSKQQLEIWQNQIKEFLRNKLKLQLHKDKSKIIKLFKGIDFVGFRNFHDFKLLRKRCITKMRNKIKEFHRGEFIKEKLIEAYQGWQAHAKWADAHDLKKKMKKLARHQT